MSYFCMSIVCLYLAVYSWMYFFLSSCIDFWFSFLRPLCLFRYFGIYFAGSLFLYVVMFLVLYYVVVYFVRYLFILFVRSLCISFVL